ncbi:MAG: cold shock domain-containing protein [Actinobacteria bacterium]|nr:cold shock domain-containing protein [Actinomycetota bacterium]
MRGKVKWFSPEKGYGFVEGEDGVDAFVHYSAIETAGFRSLEEGEEVEFEVQEDAKGRRAVSVRRLKESA